MRYFRRWAFRGKKVSICIDHDFGIDIFVRYHLSWGDFYAASFPLLTIINIGSKNARDFHTFANELQLIEYESEKCVYANAMGKCKFHIFQMIKVSIYKIYILCFVCKWNACVRFVYIFNSLRVLIKILCGKMMMFLLFHKVTTNGHCFTCDSLSLIASFRC